MIKRALDELLFMIHAHNLGSNAPFEPHATAERENLIRDMLGSLTRTETADIEERAKQESGNLYKRMNQRDSDPIRNDYETWVRKNHPEWLLNRHDDEYEFPVARAAWAVWRHFNAPKTATDEVSEIWSTIDPNLLFEYKIEEFAKQIAAKYHRVPLAHDVLKLNAIWQSIIQTSPFPELPRELRQLKNKLEERFGADPWTTWVNETSGTLDERVIQFARLFVGTDALSDESIRTIWNSCTELGHLGDKVIDFKSRLVS